MGTGAGAGTGMGTADVVADDGQVGSGQVEDAAGPRYATWPLRVVAALADNAILAGAAWLALGSPDHPSTTFVFGGPNRGVPLDDPRSLVPAAALVLLLVLQGLTGWTPAKLLVGIRVVDARTSRPAGVPRTLARTVLHLVDAIFLVGYLRPLWHERRQTFADSLVGTVVVFGDPVLPRRPRLVLYAAAVTVVVLGLGYGCVPISGSRSTALADVASCEVRGAGPALAVGTVSVGGTVSSERDQRLWTVRETRVLHPGAHLTWTSDPSAREVDYRVEVEAGSDGEPRAVAASWSVGTGDAAESAGEVDHWRRPAPDGDLHEVRGEVVEGLPLGDGAPFRVTVRLLADGEEVAACVATPDDVAAATAG